MKNFKDLIKKSIKTAYEVLSNGILRIAPIGTRITFIKLSDTEIITNMSVMDADEARAFGKESVKKYEESLKEGGDPLEEKSSEELGQTFEQLALDLEKEEEQKNTPCNCIGCRRKRGETIKPGEEEKWLQEAEEKLGSLWGEVGADTYEEVMENIKNKMEESLGGALQLLKKLAQKIDDGEIGSPEEAAEHFKRMLSDQIDSPELVKEDIGEGFDMDLALEDLNKAILDKDKPRQESIKEAIRDYKRSIGEL